MDLVALAPLPYRAGGRAEFEFGASTMSLDALTGLARLGHRVRAIAQAPPATDGEVRSGLPSTVPGLDILPFAIQYRSVRTAPDEAHLDAQRARLRALLSRLVAERRPDLVWLSGEALSWFALDVCREFDLPTLVVVHGAPLAGLEHGLYPPAETAELISRLATADGFVAVADHLRQMLERMGIPDSVTVRNVIDTERFIPGDKDPELLRELSIDPAQPVIGSFSSLRPEKRVGDLIAAAPRVLAERPDAVFLLAGGDTLVGGMASDDLPRAVEERGLAASFRFTGDLDYADMPRWLNLADMVVLPSEREGYPLAALEAQACGRPTLASDIPAMRELIAQGHPLGTFPVGDSDALAKLLLELLADPVRRRELGRASRQAAVKDSLDEWVRAHARVIEDVVEGFGERPAAASA